MKLLEIKTTYTDAIKLFHDKNWKMFSEKDLDKIDVAFLKPRVNEKNILKVWLDSELDEVEDGVFLAKLAFMELHKNTVSIEVVDCNVLFLNRVIKV